MENDKNDTGNLGKEIQDIVQNAFNSMDFAKLNENISSTVNSALKEVKKAINYGNRVSGRIEDTYSIQSKEELPRYQESPLDSVGQKIGNTVTKIASVAGECVAAAGTQISNAISNARARRGIVVPYRTVGDISSVIKLMFGWLMAPCMILGEIALLGNFFYDPSSLVGAAVMAPFTAFATWLIGSGMSTRKRNKRIKQYLKELQLRGYSRITDLALATGKSEDYVLKDVKKMLQLEMFPEGRLDNTQTVLMATREATEQYYQALEDRERLRIEQKTNNEIIEKEKQRLQALSEEARRTIKQGRSYIATLKQLNEELTDLIISDKLDRLELIIDRIIGHIEKHEDQLPEINRFMDYYLPTTVKLVQAYKEFDQQPVQGANIITAKKEISNTLDTINNAFAKLFDSLFEDAAMDVSTDISVLNTMLKQEGLTKGDFEL